MCLQAMHFGRVAARSAPQLWLGGVTVAVVAGGTVVAGRGRAAGGAAGWGGAGARPRGRG